MRLGSLMALLRALVGPPLGGAGVQRLGGVPFGDIFKLRKMQIEFHISEVTFKFLSLFK